MAVVRYVARKAIGWLVMVVVATNATFFLASWFLDPRSNYRDLWPGPSSLVVIELPSTFEVSGA